MPADSIRDCLGLAVMQKKIASPQSPKRRRPNLVVCTLSAVLDDRVAGADVVQQEIAVRMDDFVSESRRYRVRTTINRRTNRSCNNRWNVTADTTNFVEKGLSTFVIDRKDGSAWRNFSCAHK